MSTSMHPYGHTLLTTTYMYVDVPHESPRTFSDLSPSSDSLEHVVSMQVKSEWLHNAGAGVISHVADSVRQTCLHANL
jgi:hypothetical protein